MDRKEFLLEFWHRMIRPVVLSLVTLICIYIFAEIIKDDTIISLMGFLAVYAIGGAVVCGLIYLAIGYIERRLIKIYNQSSPGIKKNLFLTKQILDCILALASGVVIYLLWQKNWFSGLVFIALIVAGKVREIKLKSVTRNTPMDFDQTI